MKTSVIVTCYNQEKYIAQCLDSIVFNLIPDLELIICDDCSTDSSVQIISKWIKNHTHQFERISFIQHQKNCGVTLSLNELISECRGDLISPLAGDDYYLNGAIKARRDALAFNPKWLGAFNDGLAFGNNGEIFSHSLSMTSNIDIRACINEKVKEEVISKWSPPMNLQFWRKTAFKVHGGEFEFNKELFAEDLDFALWAISDNAFGYLNKICYAYRYRTWPQTLDGDMHLKWLQMAYLFGKYSNKHNRDLKECMLSRADYYYSLSIDNTERVGKSYNKFIESIKNVIR
jgi:glycosyltransferase involved in cell wall biosynthesis